MRKLLDRANCAITVTVDGEDVSLGFPTADVRAELIGRVQGVTTTEMDEENPPAEFIALWDGLSVDALEATLREPADLTREDIGRLLVDLRQEPENNADLSNLFDAALKL